MERADYVIVGAGAAGLRALRGRRSCPSCRAGRGLRANCCAGHLR